MKHPLKWSIIAQSLSDFVLSGGAGPIAEDGADDDDDGGGPVVRTGKQCRERYVNHLNPRLKHCEFGPLEDATIWRLYATIGTQWAKMSKVLPGRTDNNLKNRFHNLKRQLQREEESRTRAPPPGDYDERVYVDRVRELPSTSKTRIEDMWDHRRNMGRVAADSVPGREESREDEPTRGGGGDNEGGKEGGSGGGGGGGGTSEASSSAAAAGSDGARDGGTGGRRFGPFVRVDAPVQCGRCGLYLPSVQCGTERCARTGWCRACARASMHLGGDVLRECLGLRRCQDREAREGVVKMLEEVWSG
ncbi:hypothetical protein ACHAWF_009614 [Thalassiosira exigua]